MASKYRYYKHKYIGSNIYRVDEFDNLYLFMGDGFHKLATKVWSKGYQDAFYVEISEEELALEILNG